MVGLQGSLRIPKNLVSLDPVSRFRSVSIAMDIGTMGLFLSTFAWTSGPVSIKPSMYSEEGLGQIYPVFLMEGDLLERYNFGSCSECTANCLEMEDGCPK